MSTSNLSRKERRELAAMKRDQLAAQFRTVFDQGFDRNCSFGEAIEDVTKAAISVIRESPTNKSLIMQGFSRFASGAEISLQEFAKEFRKRGLNVPTTTG